MFKTVITLIITSVISLTGLSQNEINLKTIFSNLKMYDNDPRSKAKSLFTYIDFSDIVEDILCNNKASEIEVCVIAKLKTLNPDDILYTTILNHMRTALGENTLAHLKNKKFLPTSMGGRMTIDRIIIPLTRNRLNFVEQMKKTKPSGYLEKLVAERVIEYPATSFATEWHHPDLYGLFSKVKKFTMKTNNGKTIWVRCYFCTDKLRNRNKLNDKIEVSLNENGDYLFVYKLNISGNTAEKTKTPDKSKPVPKSDE